MSLKSYSSIIIDLIKTSIFIQWNNFPRPFGRLSLLTVTNPNQLRDVLLFVFSKIADEASPLCSILCNLFLRLRWYVEVFKGGFEGVLVSLLLTIMRAFSNL